MAPSFHRTRIAPTPSGYLHIGNAVNFLLTDALAKGSGALMLLRIDDMDHERVRPAYVEDVFETMHWLGIDWQEGPVDAKDFKQQWSQRRRMELYKDALQTLWTSHAVYVCTCSRMQVEESNCHCRDKALPSNTPSASWRLITDDAIPLEVRTSTGQAYTTMLPPDVQNFVVRRKDGLPAYQLTSLIDDVHFGVDFIVRGQDLYESTLAQLYLARMLQLEWFQKTVFVHHPLLTDEAGAKLSKSAGSSSIKQWRENGKTRDAFFNFMSQLLQLHQPIQSGNDLLNLWRLDR